MEIDYFGIKLDGGKQQASSQQEMLDVFRLMRPEPVSKQLIRIGGPQDGSYLIPDDLEGIRACFSPGVNNFKYFEDVLVRDYGIDCHMCDYSSDVELFHTPLIEGKQTFDKKWLDNKPGDDNISLDDWVRDKAPEGDLLLQIDIEGAEYRNLLSVSDEVLSRFRIIAVEVHALHTIGNAGILRTVLQPFFKRMRDLFFVAHAHPNNCCGAFQIPGTGIQIPRVLELTYLRRDRVAEEKYPTFIPHPLDVKNVARNDHIHLGEEWLDGPRPIESRLTMVEDQLDELRKREKQAPLATSVNLISRGLGTLTSVATSLRPAATTDGGLREAAHGKSYRLSAGLGSGPSTGYVAPKSPFFFHTSIAGDQFISIDLAASEEVRAIRITNRTDMCFERARDLFLIVSATENHADGAVFNLPVSQEFLQGKVKEVEIAVPPVKGRFVTITSPAMTALHFSDLQIFVAARPS